MIYQKKNQNWRETFRHALDGCLWAFRTQKNFIVHFGLSFLVVILAWWLKISLQNFLILFLAIIFGLIMEMTNTAFEKTVDLITEEYNPKAKIVKDLSAGMMLLVSVGLAALGLIIIFPPLWQKLFG